MPHATTSQFDPRTITDLRPEARRLESRLRELKTQKPTPAIRTEIAQINEHLDLIIQELDRRRI